MFGGTLGRDRGAGAVIFGNMKAYQGGFVAGEQVIARLGADCLLGRNGGGVFLCKVTCQLTLERIIVRR